MRRNAFATLAGPRMHEVRCGISPLHFRTTGAAVGASGSNLGASRRARAISSPRSARSHRALSCLGLGGTVTVASPGQAGEPQNHGS